MPPAPEAARSPAWTIAFALLVVVGCAVRFDDVSRLFLLNDELHAVRAAQGLSPLEIVTTHFAADTSIPLSLYAWVLLRLDALNELTLRLPTLLAGALLPVVAWALAPRIGRPASLLAAALFAIWPPFVYYSIVARPYAPALLLSLLALLAWDRWRTSPTLARRLLFGVGAGMAVFFQIFNLFPIAAVFAVTFAARKRLDLSWRELLGTAALAAVTFLVLFGPGLPAWLDMHAEKVGAATWDSRTPRIVASSFGAGSALVGALLPVVGALGAFVLWRRDATFAAACLGAVGATLLGVFVLRPEGTAYAWTRYLLMGFPHLVLLIAAGLAAGLRAIAGARTHVAAPIAAAAVLVAAVWWLAPARLYRRAPDSFKTARDTLQADGPRPRVSDLYARVRDESSGDSVIECPVPEDYLELAPYSDAQRVHGLWVAVGVLRGPLSPVLGDQRNFVNLLDDARVRASGARFALLHTDLLGQMPKGVRGALRGELRWQTGFARWVLTERCGPPLAADDSVEVYDLSQWNDAAPLDPAEVAKRFEQNARRLARQTRLATDRDAPR